MIATLAIPPGPPTRKISWLLDERDRSTDTKLDSVRPIGYPYARWKTSLTKPMPTRYVSLLLLVLLTLARPAAAQTPAAELRGAWLTNVASDVYASRTSIARAMDSLAAWGFNAVFPVVFNNGSTLYPSEVMAEVTGQAVSPVYAGRDLLQDLVTEAHRVGIEVHPWLEYGFVAAYGKPGPILDAHPDWAGKRRSTGGAAADDSFYWMSQAHPDVQDFLIRLGKELAQKYDVDGIQLDRVRYGNIHKAGGGCCVTTDFGYDDAHLSLYREEHGGADPPANPADASWMRWRSRILDAFQLAFLNGIRSVSPHVLVSNAPVVYPYGYELFLQDWRMWVRDGSVDFIAPQVYRYSASDYDRDLRIAMDYARAQVPRYDRLYPGMLVRSGDYVAGVPLVESFINTSRARGAKGHIHWFYEGAKLVGPDLARSVYAAPALPPYRSGLWRPPAVEIQEDDPLNERVGFEEVLSEPNATDGSVRAGSAGGSVRYRTTVGTAAWYDVFVYAVAGGSEARMVLPGGEDIVFDQEDAAQRGWLRVGSAYLETGLQEVARFEHAGPSGTTVRADAVMLQVNRRLSPDAVFVSRESDSGVGEQFPGGFEVFPNPMSTRATLALSLDQPGLVRVTLLDMLGRDLGPLVDATLPAGSHEVGLSGTGLAPGAYLAVVRIDGATRAVPFVRR